MLNCRLSGLYNGALCEPQSPVGKNFLLGIADRLSQFIAYRTKLSQLMKNWWTKDKSDDSCLLGNNRVDWYIRTNVSNELAVCMFRAVNIFTSIQIYTAPYPIWQESSLSSLRNSDLADVALASLHMYSSLLKYIERSWILLKSELTVPTLHHTIFLSSVFLITQRNAFYAMLDVNGMGDWLRMWFLLLSIRPRRGTLRLPLQLHFKLKKNIKWTPLRIVFLAYFWSMLSGKSVVVQLVK
jgi:hypothetical protein